MKSLQSNMSKVVTDIIAVEHSNLTSTIKEDLSVIQTAANSNFDDVRF